MIAYNLQPLASENLTGIGYYSANIINALNINSDGGYEAHVFDFLGRNNAPELIRKHLGDSINRDNLHVVKNMPLGAYIRAGKLGKIYPYELLTGSEAELTVFFNYLAPEGLKGKSIITIYDMVCGRYPETMDDKNRALLQRHLQKSADNASAIITISEFSKREIIDLLKIPEERIFVAPCGVDVNYYCPAPEKKTEEQEIIKKEYNLDKYILYVGTLEPRKNIITLIKAFNEVAKTNSDIKLVLAGGVGWHSEATLAEIENSPYKDRIVKTGYISQEMKRILYRNAEVFVFPSLYEGFGMPVTEAMACGCQAICSNASSLPEISDSLNPLIETMDVKGYADAINDVLNGKKNAPDILSNSVKRYTWEQSAKVIKSAIDSVKA